MKSDLFAWHSKPWRRKCSPKNNPTLTAKRTSYDFSILFFCVRRLLSPFPSFSPPFLIFHRDFFFSFSEEVLHCTLQVLKTGILAVKCFSGNQSNMRYGKVVGKWERDLFCSSLHHDHEFSWFAMCNLAHFCGLTELNQDFQLCS